MPVVDRQLAESIRNAAGAAGQVAEPVRTMEAITTPAGTPVPFGPLNVLRRVADECGVTVASFRSRVDEDGKRITGKRWEVLCRMLAAGEMRARCRLFGKPIALSEIGAYLTESGPPLDHSAVHYYLAQLARLRREHRNERARVRYGTLRLVGSDDDE